MFGNKNSSDTIQLPNKTESILKMKDQSIMSCLVHCGLTLWMPLRPYPGSEADLQTKSKIQKKVVKYYHSQAKYQIIWMQFATLKPDNCVGLMPEDGAHD